jgi:hypothetical protein
LRRFFIALKSSKDIPQVSIAAISILLLMHDQSWVTPRDFQLKA